MMVVPRACLTFALRHEGKMAVSSGNRKNLCWDPGYRAYLLRCWQEAGAGPDGHPAWRFALVKPGGEGTPRGFASLESLVAFLREELERGGPGAPGLQQGDARR